MTGAVVADPARLLGRFSRRRAIRIFAGVAGLPLLSQRIGERLPLYRFAGSSLGSPSRLTICHPDFAVARDAVSRCLAEIARLERVFALFLPDSELSRLNHGGRLQQPSLDLLTVLSFSLRLSQLTDGAFDVSVQPLWELYAAHFFGQSAPPAAGPSGDRIASARALVDWRSIDVSWREVALARSAMALTLNGIAQGYVADRITEILREAGCDRVLTDLGCSEIYALGRPADDRPWRVGLADPRQPDSSAAILELCDGAVCTSGGYGTKFEATGRFHHLFDPLTGSSANRYLAVSVLAKSAMVADALSTALYVSAPERAASLIAEFPGVQAVLTRADGNLWRLAS